MHSIVFAGVQKCIKRSLLGLVVSWLGSLDARTSDSGRAGELEVEGRRIASRAGRREVLAYAWGLD